MLAVLFYKVLADKPFPVPKGYTLFFQILIGVMFGASCTPEIGRMLLKTAVPIEVDVVPGDDRELG